MQQTISRKGRVWIKKLRIPREEGVITRRMGLVSGLLCALLVLGAAYMVAGATLVWDPVPGEVTGYKVYYGAMAGAYPNSVNLGRSTSRLLDNLPNLREGVRHYFSVTSYNASGESAYSSPVSWIPPDKTPLHRQWGSPCVDQVPLTGDRVLWCVSVPSPSCDELLKSVELYTG